MAKKAKNVTNRVRREYTKADVKELRAHSKAKTPVDRIAQLTKRSVGSLRQKALALGIGLGHQLDTQQCLKFLSKTRRLPEIKPLPVGKPTGEATWLTLRLRCLGARQGRRLIRIENTATL